MPSQNGTQAIDRAAHLLAQVLLAHDVQRREAVSFTELAVASGLAKSTTSRLLMALERHQLVRRDGLGRFWPGELFVRYAWRGTATRDLVAIAQPFLEQLGEQTSETINLGIASGGAGGTGGAGDAASAGMGVTARAGGGGAGSDDSASGGANGMRTGGANGVPRGGANDTRNGAPSGTVVEQIAQVNSRYMIGGTNWVGLAVPLHCSALGKVLLAFGAADMPLEPFEARTKRTITTRAQLEAELAFVRERGYGVTDEELEPGLVAVAAPVFAGSPTAIAAISVSAPASRLMPDQVPATGAKCAAIADALSVTLGGGSGRVIAKGAA